MRKIKWVFLLVLMFSLVGLSACGHEHSISSDWSNDDAKHWHDCVDCEETFDVENHKLTWRVKTAATCKVALVEEGVCICGYTTTKTGSKADHQLKDLVGVAATCTESGLTEGKVCGVCNEITVAQKEIPALGHKEEIIAGKAATCTEPGLTEGKVCGVCNEITVAQKEIPALGHKEEIIAGKAATCTEPGLIEGKVCGVCNEITVAQKEIPALGHKEEIIAGKAATCTEPGLTEGKVCGVCNEITVTQKEIPALGHKEEIIAGKAATCTEPGLTEGKVCGVCNEITVPQEEIKALGHDITGSYYEEQDGVMMFVEACSRCGALTTEVDVTKPIEVNNYNDLVIILAAGYDTLLTSSVDLPTAIVISKDVNLIIASGVNITLTHDTVGDGAFRVISGATLTINGQGTINGVGNNDYNMAIWANGGHVIINGGTFTNVGATGEGADHFDLLYVSSGGSITINDGTFIAQTPKWTLNIKDNDLEGKIIVNGGLFKDYNPANSQTEPVGANNNFVTLGYISLLDINGYYKVVKQTSITEALEIGGSKEHNTYTQEKYILVGTIIKIDNTQYGNMYIEDSEGNEIYIYGLYSNDGKIRYDAMSYKPVVGDVIIINGVLGKYNTTVQTKNAWLLSCTIHTCVYSVATCTAPQTCGLCGNKIGETLPHTDDEKDHECDVCESRVGVHEDMTGDLLCDYCGEKISDETPVVQTLAEFTLGTNGSSTHHDGDSGAKTSYKEAINDITLNITGTNIFTGAKDAKGNSCLKLGSSGTGSSLTFTVADNVTEVVIYVAKYKSNNTSIKINGKTFALTKASNNGEYDIITIDTSTTKTITLSSGASGDKRCMINTIVFNGYVQ